MRRVNSVFLSLAVLVLLIACPPAWAQSTLDIEDRRRADLEKLKSGIPNPAKLREIAASTFAKPISQQNEDILRSLADESNRYANMVNFIKDEYDEYHRDSYRFDFVLKKLSGPRNAYGAVFNEFLGIRNRAYFNLGMKAKEEGKIIEALLLFRDAYRLSNFDCGKRQDREDCMRWRAEQELQKLLGLSSIAAYVSWQKQR